MLHQPYPVTEKSPLFILLTGLAAGVFIVLFLIIFQPFGTDTVSFPNKNLFLAGYGAIVAVVFWLASLIPVRFFNVEHWTVGKQLIMVSGCALVGITASYFYLLLLGGSPSWYTYGIFVGNAMTLAVFPITGFTVMDYLIKYRKYEKGARHFNTERPPRTPLSTIQEATAHTVQEFIVRDEQDRPLLTLSTDQIWCLRSDRNYVDIIHLDRQNEVKKTTIRNTLAKLSEELPAGFLRCHRSYVVNAEGVATVSGNAQGYQLHHPDFPEVPVPVSRGKSAGILGYIQQ
ncbi:LytTR family DNA-binding domain-containing protein [Neolewinella persica]|uniref:LytTR family DNA-binding domain-containing protein n=1 Tax=Neolewinella persica TaxID=70998 RepID=UPI0003650FD3|nr:LytTR family DNA-binding domain-containing protein [Neolewinella persica]